MSGAARDSQLGGKGGGGGLAGILPEFLVTGYVEMFAGLIESGTPSESPLQSARSHLVAPMQRAPG